MEDARVMEDVAAELEGLAVSEAGPVDDTQAPLTWAERRARVLDETRRRMQALSPRRVWELAVLAVVQDRLIFPGQRSKGQPIAQFKPPPGAELLWLTGTRGDRIAALFGPALARDGRPLPDAARRPTLLFFYGNDMFLAVTQHLFERLRRSGVNVLIPEFLGYGLSDGRPCEAACYETADAAWRHLQKRKDIDRGNIIVGGASLGGAVAIDLAARADVAGLMTIVTFSSIPDVARHTHPHVPIWRFIRHRFESEKKMPRVTCPALIGHSTGDRLVPYAMADRLAAAAGGPVRRLVIEGANHKSTEMLEKGGDKIFAALDEFLLDLAAARS